MSARIITIENPVLRQTARDVLQEEISSAYIQRVIKDMTTELAKEKFGVAIAAPQIGESVRIFLVAGHVFANLDNNEHSTANYSNQVYINPTTERVSKKMRVSNEGCLSIPGKYGPRVARPDKISITYYDEHSAKHSRGASGFLAQIFQHEMDHLDGILYIDHALEVIDVDTDMRPIDTDHDRDTMRSERIEH